MNEDTIVRTTGLRRVYRAGAQEVHALAGIDLSVPQGAFVAIEGRSGSGKTTLLNCIGGLDRPTSGRVYIMGQDICDLGERQRTQLRRATIGFVFQSFALLPTYSAQENIDLVLRIAGVASRQRQRRVQYCLEMTGIAGFAHHRPPELSGGQQQRLAIARALALRSPLLLADEPTGELDAATARQAMILLRDMVASEGITIIMATHNLIATEYATSVYVLEDGKIMPTRAPQAETVSVDRS